MSPVPQRVLAGARLAHCGRLLALSAQVRLHGRRTTVSDPTGRRRRAARLAVGAAIGTAVTLAALPYAAAPLRLAELQALHAASLGVEIVDARGGWIGVVPAALTEPRQDGRRYRTIVPDEVPEGWFRILLALEDRHLDRRTLHGQDPLRLAWLFLRWLAGAEGGGGSGLASQLTRSLRMLPTDDGGLARLSRKLVELVDGMVLHRALGGRDGRQFRQWIGAHMPLVIGAPGSRLGGEIRGVALAARVLWDKAPAELSLAEQAVLAAATRRPILVGGGEAAATQRQARWQAVMARAALGLRLAYCADDTAMAAALAELAAMPAPAPHPAAEIAPLLPADPALRLRVAANPEARAVILALHAVREAHRELTAHFGPGYPEQVEQIRLEIDAVDNLRFARRLDGALAAIERRLGGRLALGLTERQPQRQADIVVALLDSGGAVRRYFARGGGARWQAAGGGAVGRRHVGSIGKMLAAVLFARLGDTPHTPYCNRAVAGGAVANHDGGRGTSDCRMPQAQVLARIAFGRSLNLPIIDALARLDDSSIRAAATAAGLPLAFGVPARVALPLGLAAATPADVARLTGQIARLSDGSGGRAAPGRFVAEATLRTGGRAAAEPISSGEMNQADIMTALDSPGRRYLADVLAAPLAPGGTLAGLGAWLREEGIERAIAKSGTSETPAGHNRDKWIAAAVKIGGEWHIAVVLVGSPDPGRALGERLGGAFAPLAIEALRGIVARQSDGEGSP